MLLLRTKNPCGGEPCHVKREGTADDVLREVGLVARLLASKAAAHLAGATSSGVGGERSSGRVRTVLRRSLRQVAAIFLGRRRARPTSSSIIPGAVRVAGAGAGADRDNGDDDE